MGGPQGRPAAPLREPRGGTLADARGRRRRALRLVLSLAALGLAGAAPAEPPPPAGTRSLYLLDVPFLHLAPLALEAPPPGRLALSFEAAYANTYSHTWHAGAIQLERGSYGAPFTREDAETLHRRHPEDAIAFLDGELTRLSLRGAVGLTRELSLAFEVPVISFRALRLDGAIETFHSAFGLADVDRDVRPRGRFQVVRQRPGGALEFDDRTPAAGLSDVSVAARYRRDVAGSRLGVDAVVKLPTGDAGEYRGSGSWDAGLHAGAARRFGATGRLGVRLEAGVVVPGRFRGEVPTSFRVSPFTRLALGVDLRIFRRTYVSLAALREESPFRRDPVGDGARASGEVALGLACELGARGFVSLSLTENLPGQGDAADVVIALSFGTRR